MWCHCSALLWNEMAQDCPNNPALSPISLPCRKNMNIVHNARCKQQIYSRNYFFNFVSLLLRSSVKTVLVRSALGSTAPGTCPSAALKAHCTRPGLICPINYQNARFKWETVLTLHTRLIFNSPYPFENCNGLIVTEPMEGLTVHCQDLVSFKNTLLNWHLHSNRLNATFDLTLIQFAIMTGLPSG